MTAFAILKVDDSFNYYSSFSANLNAKVNEVYEYRVAEVVGWKNMQKKVLLRAGPGVFWGFNGYLELDLEKYKEYVEEYYVVEMAVKTNISTE